MHPALIAELTWYAEVFEAAEPLFEKLTDLITTKIIEACGVKESGESERLSEQRLADTRTEQLEALKHALERMDIEVPPIPLSYPKIS